MCILELAQSGCVYLRELSLEWGSHSSYQNALLSCGPMARQRVGLMMVHEYEVPMARQREVPRQLRKLEDYVYIYSNSSG